MNNKLLIAAAGAGKTTHIVKKSLECTNNVLITTFTEENENEIKRKFYELNNGVIPSNISIRTWFSFLIEHGVKPYQGILTDKKINGLLLVNNKSGLNYYIGRSPVYYKEALVDKHYFSKDYQIYSDKLSKFVVRCNTESGGRIIKRISNLFQYIFIDEVQDMAGYDLEIIMQLLKSTSVIQISGDPRQVTYTTHFADKYKKYSKGKIQDFILDKCSDICDIDTETLKNSWRNNQMICDFSNKIFPEFPATESLHRTQTEHDGVYLVREKDVGNYLNQFSPTQLRYSKSKIVNPEFEVKNYGGSKGITRDRVLIYPTAKVTNWIMGEKDLDNFDLKCKLYVAVTRAKYSVAFVCKNKISNTILPIYEC